MARSTSGENVLAEFMAPCLESATAMCLLRAAQHGTDSLDSQFLSQRTIELRDKGIGLVPVHSRAGAWIHVTRCPAADINTVSGT